MNDNELKAVIEIAQTLGLIVVAICGVITTVFTYLTRKDVSNVVKHTNSMKDELVAAVKLAATEAGKDIGRKEEQARASR